MDINFDTDKFHVCRTCMNEITSTSPFFYLDYTPIMNTQFTIKQKLYSCIPELDLSIVSNGVICNKCADIITSFYEFKEKCLKSEVQIRKYTKQIQHTGDVNLAEVIRFHHPHNENLDIKVEMEDIEIMEEFKNEDLISNSSAFNKVGDYTEPMETKYFLELEKVDTQHVHFNAVDYNINHNLSATEVNSDTHNSSIAPQNCLPKVTEHQEHHMENNTGERHFSYSICKHRSSNKTRLKQHMRIHTGEKPFSCSICEFRCNTKGNIKQHMLIHTGEKPFSCSVCEYQCKYKANLNKHMQMHTGEKPFVCSVCEYQTNCKSHLNRHMQIHTGKKPFSCSVCEYQCSQKSHLKQHMQIHTGERPYSCSVCEHQCGQKIHLKQHMKIHIGEKKKPFSCSVCEYQCNTKCNLKRHMQMHTGETPFSCSVCEYQCSQKCNLKQHMRIHSREKVFV